MDFFDYINLIFIVLLFSCFIYGYGKKFLKMRKSRLENLRELEKPHKTQEVCKIGACIIKMECYIKKVGIKFPQSIPTFCCTFLTDNGEEKTYEISEGLYRSLKENQKGFLATVDGKFLDFYTE